MDLFRHLNLQTGQVPIEAGGDALKVFAEASFSEDDCSDAKLEDVIRFLRGCRGLEIPAQWRPLLPKEM